MRAARPQACLARGPPGLQSATAGSINAEIVERASARKMAVAGGQGVGSISLDLVLAWAPDMIVTQDRDFAAGLAAMPVWASVPAVAAGRAPIAPSTPFGLIDGSPW